MRAALTILAILAATSAAAHPGHLGAFAGHDHWVAAGAIGLAVLAGLWGALKGRGGDKAEADEQEAETETEEARS